MTLTHIKLFILAILLTILMYVIINKYIVEISISQYILIEIMLSSSILLLKLIGKLK